MEETAGVWCVVCVGQKEARVRRRAVVGVSHVVQIFKILIPLVATYVALIYLVFLSLLSPLVG